MGYRINYKIVVVVAIAVIALLASILLATRVFVEEIERECSLHNVLGILVSESNVDRVLMKYNLSREDILLASNGDKIVFLYPVYNVRVYKFLYIENPPQDKEVYYLDRNGLIIVIGSDDMVLKTIRYTDDGREILVYDPYREKYYSGAIYIPEDFDVSCMENVHTIIYLDNYVTYTTLFGSKELDITAENQELSIKINSIVDEERETVVKCRASSECIGPCEPPKVYYHNFWPIYYYPTQYCCKTRYIVYRVCSSYPGKVWTLYGRTNIYIRSTLDTKQIIMQATHILDRLMTG